MPESHGTFCWNELMTTDVEKAKAFYAGVLGWTFEGMPMDQGTYWIAKSGDEAMGGIMDMRGVMPPGVPPHWFAYIEVTNVDASVKSVKDGGGQVIRDPFDVPGVGRIAIVADPIGAPVGLISSVQ